MSETSPAEDRTAVRPAEPFAPPGSTGSGPARAPGIGSDTGVIDYQRPGARAIRDRPLVGLDARSVSAWFGDHKVLERVSLKMELGAGDGADRAVRLR